MFPVTRSGNTESCCKTHVEQAAQDGQNDGQSEDNREVNILELHACDGALGLEEACVGQGVETKGGQNGGSVEHCGIGHGSGLLQNGSGFFNSVPLEALVSSSIFCICCWTFTAEKRFYG